MPCELPDLTDGGKGVSIKHLVHERICCLRESAACGSEVYYNFSKDAEEKAEEKKKEAMVRLMGEEVNFIKKNRMNILQAKRRGVGMRKNALRRLSAVAGRGKSPGNPVFWFSTWMTVVVVGSRMVWFKERLKDVLPEGSKMRAMVVEFETNVRDKMQLSTRAQNVVHNFRARVMVRTTENRKNTQLPIISKTLRQHKRFEQFRTACKTMLRNVVTTQRAFRAHRLHSMATLAALHRMWLNLESTFHNPPPKLSFDDVTHHPNPDLTLPLEYDPKPLDGVPITSPKGFTPFEIRHKILWRYLQTIRRERIDEDARHVMMVRFHAVEGKRQNVIGGVPPKGVGFKRFVKIFDERRLLVLVGGMGGMKRVVEVKTLDPFEALHDVTVKKAGRKVRVVKNVISVQRHFQQTVAASIDESNLEREVRAERCRVQESLNALDLPPLTPLNPHQRRYRRGLHGESPTVKPAALKGCLSGDGAVVCFKPESPIQKTFPMYHLPPPSSHESHNKWRPSRLGKPPPPPTLTPQSAIPEQPPTPSPARLARPVLRMILQGAVTVSRANPIEAA